MNGYAGFPMVVLAIENIKVWIQLISPHFPSHDVNDEVPFVTLIENIVQLKALSTRCVLAFLLTSFLFSHPLPHGLIVT